MRGRADIGGVTYWETPDDFNDPLKCCMVDVSYGFEGDQFVNLLDVGC